MSRSKSLNTLYDKPFLTLELIPSKDSNYIDGEKKKGGNQINKGGRLL